jgi:outer membrane receptor protein involved in Fe transport
MTTIFACLNRAAAYARFRVSLAAVLAACGALSATGPVHAQQANAAEELQEVTITGSRVITNGNDSPTPVTVLSTETLLATQTTTVPEALTFMPQFIGSTTQSSNPGPSANNASAAYLNLRALGANRSLILYDGHRMPSTAARGDVDTNQIPQLLLQRVDIVTGGASAVYGSDAIAGVVNFITDTKFNGFKANLRTGISNYGDDNTFDASFAVGRGFMGGKLHLEASYEYLDDPGIFTKLRRPWGRTVWGSAGAGTAANPYVMIANERLSNSSFGGVITSGALNGLEFNQNGIATPFVHGTPTGTANIEVGGDGVYYTTASLKSLLREHQAFTRADYDFTDNLHGYLQVAGTALRNMNFHQNNEVRGTSNFGVLGLNNAFLRNVVLPTGITNPYNANCTANTTACTFQYGKIIQQAPTLNPETLTYQMMYMTGLDGSLGKYNWEVGYERTHGTQHTRNNANLHSGRLLAAENAVINPANGQIVCNAALVNPAVYGSCVPLNLFGPTSENMAAINYILAVTDYWARTRLDDFNASISGSPFSTWAGPVNMALSGEYRKQVLDVISNAQPSDHPDCVGIQFNCTANTALWISNVSANRTPVSFAVREAAYEAGVPLAKDIKLVKDLELNGAVRYTNYNTSGTVWSWKGGLVWHLNDQLTVRTTRSRDIRAPNLNELFAPQNFSPNGYVDRHTGFLQQQVPVYSQGNPNLKPEKANTITVGFVWSPRPNFSLTVDGYRIKISEAISSVSGQGDAIQKLCEDSGGTSIYCSLYERPLPFSNTTAANFPTKVFSTNLNIAKLDTYGADVEANYGTTIFGRRAQFRALVGYQPHIITDSGPAGITDTGDTPGTPSIKLSAYGNFQITENVKLQIQEQWRNTLGRGTISTLVYADGKIPAVSYTNMNVSYDQKSRFGAMQWFLTVKNMFNQQPVPWGGNTVQTVPGLFGGYVQGDDNIGRYYTVGVRWRP